MKSSTHTCTLKVLTPKQAQQRRRELETAILHLIDQDNGPQDTDPMPYDINLEQRTLSPDGFESMQRIKGHVSGGMLNGKAEFVSTQEGSFDADREERWDIAYGADKIVCERWRGEPDSEHYYHSLESISRDLAAESHQIEWKLSG